MRLLRKDMGNDNTLFCRPHSLDDNRAII